MCEKLKGRKLRHVVINMMPTLVARMCRFFRKVIGHRLGLMRRNFPLLERN